MTDNVAGQTTTGNTPATDAPNFAVGRVEFDGTSITATEFLRVLTGFKPKYVCFENVTDRIKVEWYEGMAVNSCIKTAAAGTVTLEVTGGNGGITVDDRGFRVLQDATLAVIAASKVTTWRAQA
jgi:hypothetical protein